jgi:hypothetical protein
MTCSCAEDITILSALIGYAAASATEEEPSIEAHEVHVTHIHPPNFADINPENMTAAQADVFTYLNSDAFREEAVCFEFISETAPAQIMLTGRRGIMGKAAVFINVEFVERLQSNKAFEKWYFSEFGQYNTGGDNCGHCHIFMSPNPTGTFCTHCYRGASEGFVFPNVRDATIRLNDVDLKGSLDDLKKEKEQKLKAPALSFKSLIQPSDPKAY